MHLLRRPISSVAFPLYVFRIVITVLLAAHGAQPLHRNRRAVGDDIAEWRQKTPPTSPPSSPLAVVVDLDRSITANCLELSEYRNCAIFNRCCDFRCVEARPAESPTRRRELLNAVAAPKHFCVAILGEILVDNTRCVCNSAVSSKFCSPFGLGGEGAFFSGGRGGGRRLSAFLQKVDFVGSVILLFVFDLLLLSFTL